MAISKSRIIQIEVLPERPDGHETLYVLREDGTLERYLFKHPRPHMDVLETSQRDQKLGIIGLLEDAIDV